MKVSNCPNCGAPVKDGDSHCSYCGSYFKVEVDSPFIFVEHPRAQVLQGEAVLSMDEIQAMGEEEATKLAIREIARKMSEKLIPYLDYSVTSGPFHGSQVIRGRIRVLDKTMRF